MDALKALELRKSSRSYLAKAVEQEKVEAVVKAACNAPKAGDFHIAVVQNAEIIKHISDKTSQCMKESGVEFLAKRASLPGYEPLYSAPVLIIFSAPEGNPYGMANCAGAAANATVAATALELASCYMAAVTRALKAEPETAAKIGVPAGNVPMCGVVIGYPGGEDKFTGPKVEFKNVSYYK